MPHNQDANRAPAPAPVPPNWRDVMPSPQPRQPADAKAEMERFWAVIDGK